MEAVALANIGANAHERGDAIAAEASLRRAVEIHEGMHLQWGSARSLCDLGGVLRDSGRHHEALTSYQRALELAQALGDHRLIAVALAGIATVLIRDDQHRLGSWFFGAVAALRPIAGKPSFLRTNETAWEQAREAARSALGQEPFARAWDAGARAPLDEVIAVARRATRLGPNPIPSARQPLTRQERSVMRTVTQDLTTGMIAELLGISERTVNSHLSAIFRKYDVRSRLELLALVSHHRRQAGRESKPSR
jgi:DNA-binding CsgD family transcriptional regulator